MLFLGKAFGKNINSFIFAPQLRKHTGVAQLVEHWSPKPGVGRSSRSSRANEPCFWRGLLFLSGQLPLV